MRKAKVLLVTLSVSMLGVLIPRPASAMTCIDELQPACAAAATVICKVVAKGQPCLM